MNYKVLSFLSILIFSSCSEDIIDNDIINNSKYEGYVNTITPNQIFEMGLDTTGIIDCGTYYIVENDIIVRKQDINTGTTRSYRTDNYTSNHRAIDIYFDSSVPSSSKWRTALAQVINFYNSNTGLEFRQTGSASNADITIILDFIRDKYMQIVPNAYAQGTFPTYSGAIGNTVIINKYNNSYTENSKSVDEIAHILKHEFGHCLGLRHSDCIIIGEIDEDGVGETLIDGTPNNDPDSYMNSGNRNKGYGYSNYDLIALETLWPYKYHITFANTNLQELAFEYHVTPYKLSRFIIPTSPGKVFAGWQHTNMAYSPFNYDYELTEDKTLYASWKEPYTRTVVNGDTYGGTQEKIVNISTTSVATLTCTVQRGLNTWSQLESAWGTNTILEKKNSSNNGRQTIYKFEMKEHIVYPWPSGQTISKSIDLVLDPGVYYLTSKFTTACGEQNVAMGNHGVTFSKLEY